MSRLKWLKRCAATAAALILCATPVLGESAKADTTSLSCSRLWEAFSSAERSRKRKTAKLLDIPDYFVARHRAVRSKL